VAIKHSKAINQNLEHIFSSCNLLVIHCGAPSIVTGEIGYCGTLG
jgi:hypothetical protein